MGYIIGKPKGIIIHHSVPGATGASNITELRARAKSYDRTHSTRSWAQTTKTDGKYGFFYISYHHLVARNGESLQVQDEKWVRYHASNKEANFNYIAVCLDGNYQTEKPTNEMREWLINFIIDFQKRYGVDAIIRGHCEVADASAKTSCPGNNIGTSKSGWIKEVIDEVNRRTSQPKPKEWWEEVEKINDTLIESKEDTFLYEIDSGKGLQSFKKGLKINVAYKYKDWYITQYSFDKRMKNGFKVSSWGIVLPDGNIEKETNEKIRALEEKVAILDKNVRELIIQNDTLRNENESLRLLDSKYKEMESFLKRLAADQRKLDAYAD